MKNIFHFICIFIVFFSTNLSGQGLITEQATLPCVGKKFTIIAHIVLDELGDPGTMEEVIIDQLDGINEKFSPICVSFQICEFRYIENYQYNMLLLGDPKWPEMNVKYHQHNRINMFFVEDIDEACGFASLGGIQQMQSGGVVINKSCIGQGTITHELGHFFGLPHTFEGSGTELVDGTNCTTAGDGICDTPADPFIYGEDVDTIVVNCRYISQKIDSNGQYYEPDVGNIMSYYPCRCGFTYQQYLRMANTFLLAPNMW